LLIAVLPADGSDSCEIVHSNGYLAPARPCGVSGELSFLDEKFISPRSPTASDRGYTLG
jgi:hypothetical protein